MYRNVLLLILTVFSLSFQSAKAQVSTSAELTRQAFMLALDDIEASLRGASALKGQSIVVLPFTDEKYSFLTSSLKNSITNAGLTVLEEQQSTLLESIYSEIEWHERKSDLLSPGHIAKFGRFRGASCIMYGFVNAVDINSSRAYVELELHVANIATREHVWGNTFVSRYQVGRNMVGQTSLTPNMRRVLSESFNELKSSLNRIDLSSVKSINVIPLAGDCDDYITTLALGLFSGNQHAAVRYNGIPTLVDARTAIRERDRGTDAILYGSVRDIHVGESRTSIAPDGKNRQIETQLYASIQLHLEDIKGNILWSKTLEVDKALVEKCHLTPEEVMKYKEDMQIIWFRNQKLVFEREEADAKIKHSSLLRLQKLEYAAMDLAHDKWLKENKIAMEKELALFHKKIEELSRADKLDTIAFAKALNELSQAMQKQQREFEIQLEGIKHRQQLDLQGLEGSRLMLLKEYDIAQYRREEEIRTLNQDIERQRKQLLQQAEKLAAELDLTRKQFDANLAMERKKHDAALEAAKKDYEVVMKKRIEEFELQNKELVAENKALMQAQFFKYFWVALGTVIVFGFVIVVLRLCWSHTHIG